MKKVALIPLFLISLCTFLVAQNTDTVQVSSEPHVDMKPRFRGTLRSRYEHSINENQGRFAVRNARAAVSGNANSWISYLAQVDLSDNGVLRVLDAEIQMNPTENLTLWIGQTFVPFIQKHLLTPGVVMFANEAFANRYLSASARDIGVVANYRFLVQDFPINLSGALLNGGGTNNPRWSNDLGYAFRLMFGRMDRIQVSLKTYHATGADQVKNELFGADFRYFNDNFSDGFTFEAEIVGGRYSSEQTFETFEKMGYYGQVANVYKIKNKSIKYIEPIARWDVMGLAGQHNNHAPARLTLGLNFGFNSNVRRTELRLNYEKYFLKEGTETFYFGPNPFVWHDKITLELTLNF